MRELLVIFGLVSMGYLAQSSIGMALHQSCEYYEEIANAARAKSRGYYTSAGYGQKQANAYQSVASENDVDRNDQDSMATNQDQQLIQPTSGRHRGRVTQAVAKTTRSIR